jgi:hypothetical protein
MQRHVEIKLLEEKENTVSFVAVTTIALPHTMPTARTYLITML